jgi:hypothetical protein
MTTRRVGIALVVAAYALLIFISLSAPFSGHTHAHLDPALLAQYAGPWPVALGCALSVAGIMLALVPLRRGERWALWTQLAMLATLFFTRILTDPRCLVVLDPHQHGCHSFMIATALGVVGLLLAGHKR